MDFEEILNALEDLVENSWTLPMSGGRTVVDSAQILEFVKEKMPWVNPRKDIR